MLGDCFQCNNTFANMNNSVCHLLSGTQTSKLGATFLPPILDLKNSFLLNLFCTNTCNRECHNSENFAKISVKITKHVRSSVELCWLTIRVPCSALEGQRWFLLCFSFVAPAGWREEEWRRGGGWRRGGPSRRSLARAAAEN